MPTIPKVTRLAVLRRKKGLSQMELSHATGIRQSRISEFETGRIPTANITLKTAVTLAKALNVHAEDLLD